MIRVEREEYLRQHPQTKANGYYERDLKTAIGTIEGLKVARSRDSGFHSALLPYRASSSIDLSELIMALFAVGVSTRKISHLLQLLYDMRISAAAASRMAAKAAEQLRRWRMRPLQREYAVVFIDATFFPDKKGQRRARADIHGFRGKEGWDQRDFRLLDNGKRGRKRESVGRDTEGAFTARGAASRAVCGRWAYSAGGGDKESIPRKRLRAMCPSRSSLHIAEGAKARRTAVA